MPSEGLFPTPFEPPRSAVNRLMVRCWEASFPIWDSRKCNVLIVTARKGNERVFSEGFVTDYLLTIRQRDGRLANVVYNASVYRDAKGQVLGVFAVCAPSIGWVGSAAVHSERESHRENARRSYDRVTSSFCCAYELPPRHWHTQPSAVRLK